jgi:hypothetical protein
VEILQQQVILEQLTQVVEEVVLVSQEELVDLAVQV